MGGFQDIFQPNVGWESFVKVDIHGKPKLFQDFCLQASGYPRLLIRDSTAVAVENDDVESPRARHDVQLERSCAAEMRERQRQEKHSLLISVFLNTSIPGWCFD